VKERRAQADREDSPESVAAVAGDRSPLGPWKKEMTMLEVPNLNGMDQQEIRAFAKTLTGRSRVPRLLRFCCDMKDAAIEFRLAGKIHDALDCEELCEAAYRQMPVKARW
jgi:hypothetical protein